MSVALEWGPIGAKMLSEACDVLVLVDVLSFSTSVTVAVDRGARVWPHTGGENAGALARDIGAVLAGNRGSHEGFTLSPASLLEIPNDSRLVLPSPNGSAIAYAAVNGGVTAIDGGVALVAGCLRNASAVGRFLRDFERIGVVPAGERWGDGSLRPAYEDLVGAGAVIDRIVAHNPSAELGPEAEVAALAFRSFRPLEQCPSGRELVDRGFAEDVRIASEYNVSSVVPRLVEGRFVAA
ncbi:MAG: 2-phosphosulfolactate phosphatase [Actinomycetota bacterium]|jgi:2-phosphosulfolactate phosphatase|nr:2-phosphosulfolactate phosphatase [Actinomycetota bacterium]MDQ1665209.1 2-phosphosulfolactate phosphatase [Actinomycetota bacterium]MDQ1670798.1 2-phosphosulfolactate phosphatase [Actinomycetota bacterium]